MRNLEILADFDAQAVNGGRGRTKNSLKPVKPVGPTTSWGHCAPPKPPIDPCHTHHGMGNTYAPTTQTNTANVTANGYYSGAYVGILQGNLAVGA
jgi:hypothetical protein